ncbi:MAG: DNA repair protein RecN [Oscillospiraceae bacterium]|nr:DNA repair protein RecN [Oscillospiraceae bacterium]
MLSNLHIENMAIFTAVDVFFGDGLNVLTGETGAGKSIILDALGLALGARAQKELVRSGQNKALVTALFQALPDSVNVWMSENGMDGCPDGELLLSRELSADGKTVCRVNGKVQTVAMLKALGQLILSVHGQHDTYQLFRPESHMRYVDSFLGNRTERTAYGEAYQAWHALCRERDALRLSEDDKRARIDLLRFHLDDLERLALQDGEYEELQARRKILRSASKLSAVAAAVRELLKGDDELDGAIAQLEQAADTMQSTSSMGEAWTAAAERLQALCAEVSDAGEVALDLFDGVEFSEEELEAIEMRLDIIARAEQRHGVMAAELVVRRETLQAELDKLDYADMRLAELGRAIAAAEGVLEQAANALTASRRRAADALKEAVEGQLQDLDMARVSFIAQMIDTGNYQPDGRETACFMIATNPGEPEKPMDKIASGGELARIMLALQNVLSDSISTLVFDEVDAGVSGRAAQRVAEKMSNIGRQKQVLCVTHLPQVAAFADTHLHVVKRIVDGRADTQVVALDEAGRVAEIGGLLGAGTTGDMALENAKALIESAKKYKIGD